MFIGRRFRQQAQQQGRKQETLKTIPPGVGGEAPAPVPVSGLCGSRDRNIDAKHRMSRNKLDCETVGASKAAIRSVINARVVAYLMDQHRAMRSAGNQQASAERSVIALQ